MNYKCSCSLTKTLSLSFKGTCFSYNIVLKSVNSVFYSARDIMELFHGAYPFYAHFKSGV